LRAPALAANGATIVMGRRLSMRGWPSATAMEAQMRLTPLVYPTQKTQAFTDHSPE
jgi:hypothetical protein